MIDMHTHLLPEIDDGSQSIQDTFDMLDEAYKAGFTEIITTSHYMEKEYEVNRVQRQMLIDAIQSKIDEKSMSLRLHNGAEIYIMPNLVSFVDNGTVPTLAESRYVLFELPLNSNVIYTDTVIAKLVQNRYVPIIAHPERYEMVKQNPKVALKWTEEGALLQANYASIIGLYGDKSKKALKSLLQMNLISFLGTDCHRPGSIYSKMNEIKATYKKIIGEEKFEILSTINPRKIINDEYIAIDDGE